MAQMHVAKKWWACVTLLCAALVLTGCGEVDSEITFQPDERWSARVDMTLNPSEVAMAGGPVALETQLKQQLDPLQRLVLQSKWSKEQHSDGSITYHLSMDGKGYASLNQAVFGNQASIRTVTRGGQREIHFSYTALSPGVRRFGLRLTGGRIISSNADEVRGGTAIWRTWRGSAEAVLTETGGLPDLVPILGGIVVLALAAGGVVLIMGRRKPAKAVPTSAPVGPGPPPGVRPELAACPNCDAPTRPGATFCGRCGARLTAPGGR